MLSVGQLDLLRIGVTSSAFEDQTAAEVASIVGCSSSSKREISFNTVPSILISDCPNRSQTTLPSSNTNSRKAPADLVHPPAYARLILCTGSILAQLPT